MERMRLGRECGLAKLACTLAVLLSSALLAQPIEQTPSLPSGVAAAQNSLDGTVGVAPGSSQSPVADAPVAPPEPPAANVETQAPESKPQEPLEGTPEVASESVSPNASTSAPENAPQDAQVQSSAAQQPLASKLFSIPERPNAESMEVGDGLQLNFVDTDIPTVVGTVLGDGLNLPYVIDPQVKGTLTLQSASPLSSTETLRVLETALRTQSAAIVDVNGVMNVVPIKDAPRRITTLRVPNQGEPGFGIYVVPLQYVSAAEMEKLLQPFAPEGGVIRVDASRNLLMLAGTTQEIAMLTGVVNTFDVNWLAGMATSIYAVQQVDAKTLATELGEIFSDSKSPIAGVVRIVPLARLNSLLVITPQERYLQEVEAWIRRLDVAVEAPGRRIYVYEVQNGKADDLAKSLSEILSIDSLSSGVTVESTATVPAVTGSAGAGMPSRSVAPAVKRASTPLDASADGLKIVPSPENNSLLIMGSPTEYGIVEKALRQLDVAPLQILIEASIAEVTLTDDLKFGLEWSYNGNEGPVALSQASNGGINQQFPGLSFLYTGKTNIQAVLNTLESLTNVRVLSAPKLLVLNNREAHLQVGDEVPIATQSAISTQTSSAPIVNSVQMMQTGVILSVVPRANSSGRVFLEVNQEVSAVVPTTTSGIDSPTVQQRKIASTISVDSGDTIALGGLIKETQNQSRSGVPLLSRIPLIGALFGTTGRNTTRTEMIVLLTPRIIRSSDESTQITEDLKREFGRLKKMISPTGQKTRAATSPVRTNDDGQLKP